MHIQELFDLHGSIALVTGAASGIGFAISEALAEAGAHVVLSGRTGASVQQACARLQDAGHSAEALTLDVSSRDDVHHALEATVARHGHIDTVFANAGVSGGPGPLTGKGRIETVLPEDWERILATNLSGVFFTLQAAATAMRRQRSGRIVVTASTAGFRGEGLVGYAYVAAKAAVVNLVRQAAIDLAPDNVLVNGIVPGPVITNIAGGMRNPEFSRLLTDTVLLRRFAQPYELKGAALLLASAASSFMTGSMITVDGGVLA